MEKTLQKIHRMTPAESVGIIEIRPKAGAYIKRLSPGMKILITISVTAGYRIPDTGYRIPDTGYRIPDTGYRTP